MGGVFLQSLKSQLQETKAVFIHLSDFFKENKHRYIIGVCILLVADLFQLVMPKILGIITDLIEQNAITQKDFLFYIAIIMGSALIIALARFGWRIYIFGTARTLEFWLRNKYFNHLELLSQNYFNSKKTGDLMAHATNDIQSVRAAFAGGVVMATDALFMTAMTLTMMLISIDVKLTLMALLPLPIIAVLIRIFGRQVQKRFRVVQECFSKLTDKVQESYSGIRIIKSFAQEENNIKDFQEINQLNYDKNMHLTKLFGLMHPMITLVSALSLMIALALGGNMVIDGSLSLGQFVTFITYLGLLTWPMIAMGGVINIIQRGIASMKRLNEIFDTQSDITDQLADASIHKLRGKIEFSEVSFKYPNTDIYALQDVSFKVNVGSTLAILGPTGSGKTTLASLLLRRFDLEEGHILIDNVPLTQIPLGLLRDSIGYVPQNTFLFSTSIQDNIAFSDDHLAPEKIQQYAQIAQIHDEIIDFPEGYQTLLGEKGVNLSGGQKQRISIARALIKEPKILILDDALSAVDTKTEASILNHLKAELQKSTSLIISHRISTIKEADWILVLDDGRVVQQGVHESLLAQEGLYRSIYEKQKLEDKLAKEDDTDVQ